MKLSENKIFSAVITVLILSNTFVLALDRYPVPNENYALEIFNYFFFTCFAIEMIIKLVGLGFKLYAKDKFNIFDGVIVIISSVEIVLS